MDYRSLGNSGLKVSPICLGTMMFGDRTDAAEAGRIVASARDAGVNFIDTADVYAKGESERITGKLIASDRERWVLATKVANPMGDDPNRRGTSRKWITRAVDESLGRLGTDYIDLYYVHKDVEDTPLAETLGALADLVHAGKIRHYGIGVVPYSPLARGVLTGKYAPGAAPAAESRAGRNDKRFMETEFREESLAIAQKIKAHAAKKGMSPGHFAFNWVLANPVVTSVIAGPRTLEQWSDYLAALGKPFGAEDEALVDSLVHPGHPSTPGYNDPMYPLRGRVLR